MSKAHIKIAVVDEESPPTQPTSADDLETGVSQQPSSPNNKPPNAMNISPSGRSSPVSPSGGRSDQGSAGRRDSNVPADFRQRSKAKLLASRPRNLGRTPPVTPKNNNKNRVARAGIVPSVSKLEQKYGDTDDGGESLPLRSKHIYDLDALDGLEIGEFVVKVLRDPTKNSSPKGIVDIIVDEYKGLKDFELGIKIDGTSGKRNFWLRPLLTTIVMNKPKLEALSWDSIRIYVLRHICRRHVISRTMTSSYFHSLDSLQACAMLPPDEAATFGQKLGSSLTVSLFTCANSESSVEEWYLQSDFLEDFCSTHEWFLPMISVVAHELVMRAWWGLRGKVALIFILNYINICLDFYLILLNLGFIGKVDGDGDEQCTTVGGVDEWTLGFAMAITYVIQLCAKLGLSAAQNVDTSRSDYEKWKDFAAAITFLKPAIDVKNIIASTGQGDGQIFEPTMELLAEKQLDLCFGDIPMIFCQLCNLLALSQSCSSSSSNILLSSISVSLAMIGYTQASLTYYGDTDSYLRSRVPLFYGLIPDSVESRIGTMISMMFLIASFSAARLISCAALFNHNPTYVYAFWGIDLLLFLVSIKIVQGSLKTWHMLRGPSSFFGQSLIRVVEWMTTTSAPQILFRNACSVGGRLFTFWVVYSWLVNFAIMVIAAPKDDDSDRLHGWDTYTVPIFTGANIAFLLSLTFFVYLMRKDYISTFTSTQNPKKYMYDNYWRGGGVKTLITAQRSGYSPPSPGSGSPGGREIRSPGNDRRRSHRLTPNTGRARRATRKQPADDDEMEAQRQEELRERRKKIKEQDTLNSLKCQALTVSHHLLPPDLEIKYWMKDWKSWVNNEPDWFKNSREVLLANLDVTIVGRDWAIENFWNSEDSDLQFLAASLPPEYRPDDEEISRWAFENFEEFTRNPPTWWDLRWQITLTMGEDKLPMKWWDVKEQGMFS
ncbi:hypothetical protein TrST_g7344 [Triparma strigata]|uniref:Uncharacterized protein n=1 Tax=Triparma strigata TaxID=1606541 RepID=A0A9W7ETM3_9STRA|nr:hypothetical protein TrST_g7344 [Triparma strigata]